MIMMMMMIRPKHLPVVVVVPTHAVVILHCIFMVALLRMKVGTPERIGHATKANARIRGVVLRVVLRCVMCFGCIPVFRKRL